DCAERFADCRSPLIAAKLKILLRMGLVLSESGGRDALLVGRIAGQYAKPRTAATETIGSVTLPSYRGDLVNRAGFSLAERTPDPQLLVRAHSRAAMTLNFIRALLDGGFGDPSHPEWWRLDDRTPTAKSAAMLGSYERLVEQRLARTGREHGGDPRPDFFTSREGLVLAFEEAQTRKVPHRAGWWNLSTHFPWIGARTLDPHGGHVEYFRGIENPIAIKVPPDLAPSRLVDLLEILDPKRTPGRITLIHRLGAANVDRLLPPLIAAAEGTRRRPLWVVDPMHGNTRVAKLSLPGGAMAEVRTRNFDEILAEIETSFAVHRRLGSVLGGVHFELTGENVTECVGGSSGLAEADLTRDYRSPIDPRLNDEQSIEMALLVANRIREGTAEESAGDRDRTCTGCPTRT
ncbi:MAG: 3-deoxy-7-phosphoheptulonate synthase, partial [Phycisphaerales bacterium]